MSTLAELMVYGEVRSFAKMAVFYALLSVSSYHIGSADRDSMDRFNIGMKEDISVNKRQKTACVQL